MHQNKPPLSLTLDLPRCFTPVQGVGLVLNESVGLFFNLFGAQRRFLGIPVHPPEC